MLISQVARIPVEISTHLQVSRELLPQGVEPQIKQSLTVVNQDVVKAKERGEWGSETMNPDVLLWRSSGTDLILPRGFAAKLRAGLDKLGHELEWVDHTAAPSLRLELLAAIEPPSMRAGQEKAVQELLSHRQGILQAPTGSGKSRVGLETWRRAGVTGLVCVNRIDLAEQWRRRARELFGIEMGLIGDGVWDEKPLTVAMIPTLAKRLVELDRSGFWERWGMTIIDECHHALADTFRRIIERTISRYLIGKTATPLDRDWRRPILESLLGPVVHNMKGENLVTPRVIVVKTDFNWTPQTNADKRLADTRTIYRRIISALELDRDRQILIARSIAGQPESATQLVVCRRLKYLDSLYDLLLSFGYNQGNLFYMRGSEGRSERESIIEYANESGCVILASTVADEGLDIPRISRVHLTWPQRESRLIIQQAGRGTRDHPDKDGFWLYDYADSKNSFLRAQMYARINDVYRSKLWPTEFKGE